MASTYFAYNKVGADVILYTFGQPRVGDYDYARGHDSLVQNSFRVVHHCDMIVHLPTCYKAKLAGIPIPVCDSFSSPSSPYHHGTEVFYNATSMPVSGPYEVCYGFPHNEDVTDYCSDYIITFDSICWGDSLLQDHTCYFNTAVADYGLGNCTAPTSSCNQTSASESDVAALHKYLLSESL
jgi:hypothetical protein